jgi:hypothetical protein
MQGLHVRKECKERMEGRREGRKDQIIRQRQEEGQKRGEGGRK